MIRPTANRARHHPAAPAAGRFVLLLLLLLCPLLALAQATDAGYLARVVGSVAVNGTAAKRGDAFGAGALIETGDSSTALLKFRDKSWIILKSRSSFKVDSYRFDAANPANGEARSSLIAGGMRAVTGLIGDANKSNVSYKTPVSTIGIRGTDFFISIINNAIYLFVQGGSIGFAPEIPGIPELTSGGYLVLSLNGEVMASGSDARSMAEQAGAFTELGSVRIEAALDNSVFQWGQWLQGQSDPLPGLAAGKGETSTGSGGDGETDPASVAQGPWSDDLLAVNPIGADSNQVLDLIDGGDIPVIDIGSSGDIRGQLAWQATSLDPVDGSDLDLHLYFVPKGGSVELYHLFYGNSDQDGSAAQDFWFSGTTAVNAPGPSYTNPDNLPAVADLDVDNTGGDIAPDTTNLMIENIAINPSSSEGSLPDGTYQFFVHNFSDVASGSTTATVNVSGGEVSQQFSTGPIADDRYTGLYIVTRDNGTSTISTVPNPTPASQPTAVTGP